MAKKNKTSRTKRHLVISSKLVELGRSLIKEGDKDVDYTITQTGAFLILVGSLTLSDEDMKIFSLLASMFSAKKIIDNVADSSGTVSDYINNMGGRGETYDEFIKRIKGNSDENKN